MSRPQCNGQRLNAMDFRALSNCYSTACAQAAANGHGHTPLAPYVTDLMCNNRCNAAILARMRECRRVSCGGADPCGGCMLPRPPTPAPTQYNSGCQDRTTRETCEKYRIQTGGRCNSVMHMANGDLASRALCTRTCGLCGRHPVARAWPPTSEPTWRPTARPPAPTRQPPRQARHTQPATPAAHSAATVTVVPHTTSGGSTARSHGLQPGKWEQSGPQRVPEGMHRDAIHAALVAGGVVLLGCFYWYCIPKSRRQTESGMWQHEFYHAIAEESTERASQSHIQMHTSQSRQGTYQPPSSSDQPTNQDEVDSILASAKKDKIPWKYRNAAYD